jgi:uncharacterized delta-60 repeat protein
MWFQSARRRRPARSHRGTYRPSLETLEDRCVPSAPGTLDTSFGSGGIVTTSFGSKSVASAFAVAVQPDGKIVEAGWGETSHPEARYLDVARYNPNGTLDSSFGSGGEVLTQFPNIDTGGLGGLVLQPDGKIVVGNTVNGDFELVRYNPNGTLDTTFNGSGMVSTAFPPNSAGLVGVSLESVNNVTEIVAAGWNTFSPDGHFGFALARYNLNGSLDTSFGSGGKVVTDLGYDIGVVGLAIQGDGQIIVAGENNPGAAWIVARYGTSGNLDPTFGSGGVATGPSHTAAASMIVQPDGKIVVGGASASNSGRQWALERLNNNGSPDSTFGSGGFQTGPFVVSTGPAYIRGLAIQANGKVVVAGDNNTAPDGFQLARYNPDGSLDTSFGSGGLVTPPKNGGGEALSIQPDGKIIAAGTGSQVTKNGTLQAFALARYWGDPVPVIGSFTASPNPVTSGSNVMLTASNITDAIAGSTITQVAFYLDSSNGNYRLDSNDTLLGFATQTSPGVWTFTFTVNLTPGSYTLFAQAEDSLGVFSYADSLTLTVL